MDEQIVFWNVDTQYDFMKPEDNDGYQGKLPVPGATEIEDELAYMTELAKKWPVTVVNTADWHNEETEELSDDPDFVETFPPHCMQGSKGAAYIPETRPDDPYVIDWQDDGFDEERVRQSREIVLYKDKFDVFEGSPHTDAVVDVLDPDIAIVYGVASDVCVDQAVTGLMERVFGVYVVEDAIAGLDPEQVEDAKQEWKDRGVWFGGTETVDGFIAESYFNKGNLRP